MYRSSVWRGMVVAALLGYWATALYQWHLPGLNYDEAAGRQWPLVTCRCGTTSADGRELMWV